MVLPLMLCQKMNLYLRTFHFVIFSLKFFFFYIFFFYFFLFFFRWIKIQYLEHSTRVTSFDLKNAIVHGLPERNALTGRMEFSTCNVDGLTRAISSAKERAKLLRAAGKYFKAKESDASRIWKATVV